MSAFVFQLASTLAVLLVVRLFSAGLKQDLTMLPIRGGQRLALVEGLGSNLTSVINPH